MEKIRLGETDEFISSLGLGTMYFGTRIDKKVSFSIMDYYFEKGGQFIDTANKYASWIPNFKGGESELMIGKWIQERNNRHSLFISTKVGFSYGTIPQSLRRDIIISECEKSLKRLNIDTIDLYYAHAFDNETPLEDVMESFYLLKKQGKIRYAGASNFYAWQILDANAIAQYQDWEGFCCIQQRHTYLEPSLRARFGAQLMLTPDIEEFCGQNQVSIIAYSPLLQGVYVNESLPIPKQYRSSDTDYKLKILKQISTETNVSPNALVLAWMMKSSPQIIPLVSGSSLIQMKENLQVLEFSITEEQLQLMDNHPE